MSISEQAGTVACIPVLANHRFDEAALGRYLEGRLEGAWTDLSILQFQGGHSNPTFKLCAGEVTYVLRKKPKGRLLAGAHAIEREYRAQQAVAREGVPVPHMHLLCTDETVIGEPFYVMSHVEGRIFSDRMLGGCDPAEGAAMYDAMNAMLAALHGVDYRRSLQDFGKPAGYVARQVAFWSRNYQAAKIDDLPAMDRLMGWVAAHVPPGDDSSLVHGDYRLGNLVFHPTRPEIVAILDWELATIGHPLTDLAYNCLPWHLTTATERGFSDQDFAARGIPSESAYLAGYIARSGRQDLPDWDFHVILAIFRIAAILAGVYKRALEGTASDRRSIDVRRVFHSLAEEGWALACRQG